MKTIKHILGLASILGLLALPCAAQEGLFKGVAKGVVSPLSTSVRAGVETALHGVSETAAEGLLQSAFYATNEVGSGMGFSGTIFKTADQEIYGVMAAHSLTKQFADLKLGQGFTAYVLIDGKPEGIEAKIVQHSAPGMLDLALVDFRPEDKARLTPINISQESVKPKDLLLSGGFALGRWTTYSDRRVLSTSPIIFRSPISGDKRNRTGFCGGLVTNFKKELVGIYTGSISADDNFDMGYATHAKYINNLVNAYHHNGEGTFPLVIDGEHMLDLRIDEYISEVEIYDASEIKMYHLRFKTRFSYNDVVRLLHDYEPRYIDITVRRTTWGKYHRVPVLTWNSTAALDRNCITYRYDLKQKEIVGKYNKATVGSAMFRFLGM